MALASTSAWESVDNSKLMNIKNQVRDMASFKLSSHAQVASLSDFADHIPSLIQTFVDTATPGGTLALMNVDTSTKRYIPRAHYKD